MLLVLHQVAHVYSGVELHLVMDSFAANKHPAVTDCLAANPRNHVHFTPTHAPWMNMAEIFFSIVKRQGIRRGTFRPVRDLTAALHRFIDSYNND